MPSNKLPFHPVERYSRPYPRVDGFKTVKRTNLILDRSMTVDGDAPKELVRIYSYSKNNGYNKKNRSRWPLYIAKTGHKWYPYESITEKLLNDLGECFGLKMAESDLAVISGQIRFLSKYFLVRGKDVLDHGAEIFAGYLGDMDMVQQIEAEGLSRDMLTLQFVQKAVAYCYPKHESAIMHELVRLLLYDALVGNNDRHFFNWGVIRSVKGDVVPVFSPIYDTARGLFWNEDEELLSERMKDISYFPKYLKKYCDKSRPKLGWEGETSINHFKLVEKIYDSEFYITKAEVKALFRDEVLQSMLLHINEKYASIMSSLRRQIIEECLKYRFKTINEIIL